MVVYITFFGVLCTVQYIIIVFNFVPGVLLLRGSNNWRTTRSIGLFYIDGFQFNFPDSCMRRSTQKVKILLLA